MQGETRASDNSVSPVIVYVLHSVSQQFHDPRGSRVMIVQVLG